MNCPHCGGENSDAARFCNHCAASLSVASPAVAYVPATNAYACLSCGASNCAYETNCKQCFAELTAWQSIAPEELKKYRCWKCGGAYTQITNYPKYNTGCMVAVLGLLLAPVIVGIFLIFVGIAMTNESEPYWQCRSCGLTVHS